MGPLLVDRSHSLPLPLICRPPLLVHAASTSKKQVDLGPNRWKQLREFVFLLLGHASFKSATPCLRHRLLLHPDFWLEARDPRHRYGFHLRAFHEIWKQDMLDSSLVSSQDRSFFHWLDLGAGRLREVPEISREALCSTFVFYCQSTMERRRHQVIFLADHPSKMPILAFLTSLQVVHTDTSSKWMFVLGVDARMYVARKEKGRFHHSSFHAGAPIASAGKISVQHGCIVSLEPHSGHFKPKLAHLLQLYRVLERVVGTRYMQEIRFIKPRRWTDEWPFDATTGVLCTRNASLS